MRKIVLVYQGGLANVFEVDTFNLNLCPERNARRLLQGSFRECEWFTMGFLAAGGLACPAYCNKAGDIANMDWNHMEHESIKPPFFEKMNLSIFN